MRQGLVLCLAAWVLVAGAGRVNADESFDRVAALEAKIAALEAENRRLRDEAAQRGPKATVPEAGETRRPAPGDELIHQEKYLWDTDAAQATHDHLYVKDIVSDAGC